MHMDRIDRQKARCQPGDFLVEHFFAQQIDEDHRQHAGQCADQADGEDALSENAHG